MKIVLTAQPICNFNPSEDSFQEPIQGASRKLPPFPVCPTCGLLHPDCSKESKGAVRGAGSYPRINSTPSSKYTQETQKRYEERGEVWKWLDANGYYQYAHALSSCLTTAIQFGCGQHDFVRGVSCGSPLCPVCSKQNSYAHQRRKAHFYEKLGWASTLGNMVFTFPRDLQFLDLGRGYELVSDFLLNRFSKFFVFTDSVYVAFHAIGKKLTKHPHFQGLFPIEDSRKKKIPKHRLKRLSRYWSAYLKRAYSVRVKLPKKKRERVRKRWVCLLDLPKNVQIHYEYDDTSEKVGHAIKYVSRLAFLTSEQFLSLSNEMKHYLAGLRGKRLVRGFGKLADREWRAYVASKPKRNLESEPVEEKVFKMLEGFCCPIDGEELVFVRRVSWDREGRAGYREYKTGWFCSQETYEEFQDIYEESQERYFNSS